jgi:hypothetical protein
MYRQDAQHIRYVVGQLLIYVLIYPPTNLGTNFMKLTTLIHLSTLAFTSIFASPARFAVYLPIKAVYDAKLTGKQNSTSTMIEMTRALCEKEDARAEYEIICLNNSRIATEGYEAPNYASTSICNDLP